MSAVPRFHPYHAWLMTLTVTTFFSVFMGASRAQSTDGQTIFLPLITNDYNPTWQWAPATGIDPSNQQPSIERN
jgi:hypothetical protein